MLNEGSGLIGLSAAIGLARPGSLSFGRVIVVTPVFIVVVLLLYYLVKRAGPQASVIWVAKPMQIAPICFSAMIRAISVAVLQWVTHELQKQKSEFRPSQFSFQAAVCFRVARQWGTQDGHVNNGREIFS